MNDMLNQTSFLHHLYTRHECVLQMEVWQTEKHREGEHCHTTCQDEEVDPPCVEYGEVDAAFIHCEESQPTNKHQRDTLTDNMEDGDPKTATAEEPLMTVEQSSTAGAPTQQLFAAVTSSYCIDKH